MSKAKWTWTICCFALVSMSPGGVHGKKPVTSEPDPSPAYSITFLGNLGGTGEVHATALNNFGDVVGMSFTADNLARAFVYTEETGIQDLSDMVGDGWSIEWVHDINDRGQIVGDRARKDDDGDGTIDRSSLGIRYTPGATPEVEVLTFQDAPGDNPRVIAINNDGDALGHAVGLDGHWHAILWPAVGGYVDLGLLHNVSMISVDLSDRDSDGILQATGTTSYWNGEVQVPCMWRWLGVTTGEGILEEYAIPGEDRKAPESFQVAAMNSWGDAVGRGYVAREIHHAFLYTDAEGLEDLGTLGGKFSDATGINSAGVIVGVAQLKDRSYAGFVDTPTNGMLDLKSLIVDLPADFQGMIDAWKINESGQICGPCDGANLSPTTPGCAYLITPIPAK